MIILDLFSGIGGFSKGFQDAGWQFEKHYYSDIDKYANAVYKYNFKEAEYVGDVRTISGIERPNIITFGSPCQDFSLAGKRKGLDGARSGLIRSAITLIKKHKPDIFIWENVKGVFSSNDGADFWAVIQAFANIGGYRLEWQLLNTAWFLPQNRQRIYLVGLLGTGSGQKVFPIIEDEEIFNIKEKSGKRSSQTKLITTIRPDIGSKADSTFVVNYNGNISKRKISNLIDANYYKGIDNHQQRTYVDVNPDEEIDLLNANIRRLTPIECERLQGFPDNWTKYGDYKGKIKEISDTQRYKMCGNAVTCRVVEEIGRRLI